MNKESIAIVVVAYNRYEPLKRLLRSISEIKTHRQDIPLIISVDFSENNSSIINCAEQFNWEFGDKFIITHKVKLGLKKHIFKCGDLTEKFNNVIILEDDLFVSPYFYKYAISSIRFYATDENIGGISLYSYQRAESANFTFRPLYDDFDVYFMQFPSSWGQCWTKNQWSSFKVWLSENHSNDFINNLTPKFVENWPVTSWKKLFVAYLIDKNKYFVFPKTSLTTNFGDVGQHHIIQVNIRQVDLLKTNIKFKYPEFNKSISKYDCGFELIYQSVLKLNPKLKDLNKFDVDFYCKKKHHPNDLILTKAKTKRTIQSYSSKLFPLVNNVIFNVEGNDIVLTKYKDIVVEDFTEPKVKFLEELKFLIKEILRLIYYKIKL